MYTKQSRTQDYKVSPQTCRLQADKHKRQNRVQNNGHEPLNHTSVRPTAVRLVLMRKSISRGTSLSRRAEGCICRYCDRLNSHLRLTNGLNHVLSIVHMDLFIELIDIVIHDDIGINHEQPCEDVKAYHEAFVQRGGVSARYLSIIRSGAIQASQVVVLRRRLVEDGPQRVGTSDDTHDNERQ